MAESKRIYEEGNYEFQIATLNESEGTYGEVTTIEGLVNVDITMSQTTSNIAADNKTDYLTRKSAMKGSGTITFIGLSKEDYQKLYNLYLDKNTVIVFGSDVAPRKVGISFKNKQGSLTGDSINKFTLNNCVFDLPNLSTQTIQEDDTTIRSFALNVNVNPLEFTNQEGNKDRVTFSLINSVDDTAIWEKVKDLIYVPDQELL